MLSLGLKWNLYNTEPGGTTISTARTSQRRSSTESVLIGELVTGSLWMRLAAWDDNVIWPSVMFSREMPATLCASSRPSPTGDQQHSLSSVNTSPSPSQAAHCCKGNCQSQLETPIFWLLAAGKPVTYFNEIWKRWLHRPRDLLCQIFGFCTFSGGVSPYRYSCHFWCIQCLQSIFYLFWHFSFITFLLTCPVHG